MGSQGQLCRLSANKMKLVWRVLLSFLFLVAQLHSLELGASEPADCGDLMLCYDSQTCCEADSTCCPDPNSSSGVGCCPRGMPNATCCEGYCCFGGFTCSPGGGCDVSGSATNSSIPLGQFSPLWSTGRPFINGSTPYP